MTARSLIGAEIRTLGTGVGFSATGPPPTIGFSFGPSLGLHLPSQPGFTPGCRVIIIFTGAVSPTWLDTDDISFSILDGTDVNGAMAGEAPAITDDGQWVGPRGYRSVMFGLQMQANRPWLQCRMSKADPEIEAIGRAVVLAIPQV